MFFNDAIIVMTKNIYLYADEGTSAFSVLATKHYFQEDHVTLVMAKDIIKGGIPKDVDLFIMPGGADRPYAARLEGAGNDIIHAYVAEGGTYLGICAGAYYGCQSIEFQKDTPNAICEPRELAFFHGIGIGCINQIATPYDTTLQSAAITTIKTGTAPCNALYWGGCYFKGALKQTDIIASYQDVKNQPPALISCAVGAGKAVLSGVHFEVTRQTLKNYTFDNSDDNRIKIQLADDLPDTPLNMRDYL